MSKPSIPNQFRFAGSIAAAVLVIAAGLVAFGNRTTRDRQANEFSAPSTSASLTAQPAERVAATLQALPVAFEANYGQTDSQVKYMARGSGYTLFLTASDAVFAMRESSQANARKSSALSAKRRVPEVHLPDKTASVHMKLVGANSHPAIVAGNEVPGRINYYIGNDPSKWVEGAKQYADVTYREMYPGVDLKFHGAQRRLEFDFLVSPGASPAAIELGFAGADKITTDAAGNLRLSSSAGDVELHKPVAYQETAGKREFVNVGFKMTGANAVAFALGSYDHSRELVIDPSLTYASYLGGSAEDDALAIAVDGSGNTYVTGETKSPNFNGKSAGPNFDVFVTEFNASAFVYTDIFAASGTGSGDCSGNTIAVDGSGNAYVGGSATAGFPVTSGTFRTTFGGGALDGFVAKLAAQTGAVTFSTYLGGNGRDVVNGIAVDGSGNIYVAGDTFSTNFPVLNAIQPTNNSSADSAFVTKMSASGASLAYSTYLGGSSDNLATGIALDSSNNAYVTGLTESTDFPTTSGAAQTSSGGGQDGFVTEVNTAGSAWVYSSYLGGSGAETPLGIAVDAAGEAYVTGNTTSSNFPTVNAAQSALGGSSATNVFLSKFNAGGTALLFSTYYGGNEDDSGTAVAVDSFGDPYVTGRTTSSNYPVSNAFQGTLRGSSDAFVTEFSNTGYVVYSSFLGGTGTEDGLGGEDGNGPVGGIAVDSTSNAYLTGVTASSTDFPASTGQTAYGGGVSDGFVAKVAAAPADFSVAVSPATTSVTSGQTTSTITVTVSSVNASFGQPVALSCQSLPARATCSFSNTSVTPTTAAVTSNLTISTSGSTAENAFPTNRHTTVLVALLLPISGVVVFGAGAGSRRKRLLGSVLLGLICLSLLLLPACGGNGNSGGGGGTTTPPGTYNLTVVGTAGNSSHSAPFALTVN